MAKQHLHWQPKVAVKTGIKKTIAYFREQLKKTGEFSPIKPDELGNTG